jgi:hypothetical protein
MLGFWRRQSIEYTKFNLTSHPVYLSSATRQFVHRSKKECNFEHVEEALQFGRKPRKLSTGELSDRSEVRPSIARGGQLLNSPYVKTFTRVRG